MRITTLAVAAACLAFAAMARAETMEARWGVRAGFGVGNDFRIGSRVTHLEGFELGADVPLARDARGIGGITFAPTVTFGGSSRKGADADGNIYRFMVNVKRPMGERGLYVGAGLGYSWTEAKLGQFTNAHGLATQLLVGLNLGPARGRGVQPFTELCYYDGADNRVRGWSLDIGVRH